MEGRTQMALDKEFVCSRYFKDKKNYASYLMSKARKQFYTNFISEDS